MKRILFLLIPCFLFITCNKEKKLTESFVNKIWILDSIESDPNIKVLDQFKEELDKYNLAIILESKTLKTKKNGEFVIDKHHLAHFQSYKISKDTLFLKQTEDLKLLPFKDTLKLKLYEEGLKYQPYTVEKINKFSYKIRPLKGNTSNKIFYFTDVTDLINGKVVNQGELYNKLNGRTWYPVKRSWYAWNVNKTKEQLYNLDYYIAQNAFKIQNDSLVYSFFYTKGTKVKFTEKGIYFLEPKNSKIQRYAAKLYNKELHLIPTSDHLALINDTYFLKEIEESIIQDIMTLPKNVRLGCNEDKARGYVESEVISYNVKSIELFSSFDEDCQYSFIVNIVPYQTGYGFSISELKFTVLFTEDGKVIIK